ncbi:MAG: TPM domain-containing protein [Oscillospiraceae bacterium]|nr:TPM domain-containing protein [Oscillospiraceae bacterium]
MLRMFMKAFAIITAVFCLIIPVSAELFLDTEVEVNADRLESFLQTTEKETGFKIAVLLTDIRFPSALDAETYAELFYNQNIGAGTSGVILLLNTHGITGQMHDAIIAKGYASQVITDSRIQRIFDNMYRYLTDEHDNDILKYEQAILDGFIPSVIHYAEKGASRNTGTILLVILVADIIIVLGFVFGVKRAYKMNPAKCAANYLNRESIYYRQKSDTYIRTYVTQVKIESSSGSGGSRGGGGRSSGSRTR